jgi:hypothetical protein
MTKERLQSLASRLAFAKNQGSVGRSRDEDYRL